MAAIDFPASPTVGQIFAAGNGATYQWNGTLWLPIGTQAMYVGDTPPATPGPNQLWWNSTLGSMFIYYNDGNSTQWVPVNPSTQNAQDGVLRLYSEQVLAVTANVVAVTIPLAAKFVHLSFQLQMSPSADVAMYMQGMRGATPDGSGIYNTQRTYGTTTAAPASDYTTNSTNGWLVTGGNFLVAGEAFFHAGGRQMVGSGAMATMQVQAVYLNGNRIVFNSSLDAAFSPANIDGFRIYCASSNFAIGSFLRSYVVT
jgi:hypothetical protein